MEPRRRRLRRIGNAGQLDPLEGVANFFDVGIVVALGFLLALLSYMGLAELVQRSDVTLVKNPGTPRMEIIRRKGTRIERYRVSEQQLGGEGVKLGTAYRLKSGEVIYVPESTEESASSAPR
ncbi:MAG: DUF2149 domain-containing protein [Planctomycetota bacterium]|nr:MAG: DUF2149 domain-containing protein [Planctomycetota bacterium]